MWLPFASIGKKSTLFTSWKWKMNEGIYIYMSLGFHLGSRVVFTLVIKNRLVIEKRSKPDLSITRFSRSVLCQLFTIQ